MTNTECVREEEVLELLRSGKCDDELRAHVDACALCTDLVIVAAAIVDDRDAMLKDAEIPGSGIVWWRMQVRMRDETARAAGRTLLAVQTLAVTLAAVIALAVLNFTSPGWLKSVAAAVTVDYALLKSFLIFGAPLVFLALVTWLAFAPIAAYLAMSKE